MIGIRSRIAAGAPPARATRADPAHADAAGLGTRSPRRAIPTRRIVAAGRVNPEILNPARSIAADLIVLGVHHPELKDYRLGANAARGLATPRARRRHRQGRAPRRLSGANAARVARHPANTAKAVRHADCSATVVLA